MVDREVVSLAEQREQSRQDLLLLIYKLVHGNQYTRLPHEGVRAAVKLDQDEYNGMVMYLAKEGLLNHSHTSMALSHAGIVRAEQLMKGVDHGAGQVAIVQQTFHAQVGAVHNAPGTSTVVQQASAGDVKGPRVDGRDETVFISCGQSSEEERALGTMISELVATLTPFKPYFAEQQSTLAGLTQNIFGGLNRAAGFIAVMHHRGAVTPDGRVRASVWIEQEIAIAAFLEQTLGRSLHVLAYSQKGIALEGVRQQLLLNPIEFERDDDVVDHLRKVLPTWRAAAQQLAENPFNVTIKYEKLKITGERHDYLLSVFLTNTGNSPLREYHVDLEFPRLLIEKPDALSSWVRDRSSATTLLFRASMRGQNRPLYPGDSYVALQVPYYVDNEIYWKHEDVLRDTVKAIAYADDHEPRVSEKSMAELQTF